MNRRPRWDPSTITDAQEHEVAYRIRGELWDHAVAWDTLVQESTYLMLDGEVTFANWTIAKNELPELYLHQLVTGDQRCLHF